MDVNNSMKAGDHTKRSKTWASVSQTRKNALWRLFAYLTAVMHFSRKTPSQQTNEQRPSNICYHCNELFLDAFIDILLNHNLHRLLKSGTAPDWHLKKAWESIYTEYVELTGTDDYKRLFYLSKDIGALRSKLLQIRAALLVLAHRYSEPCVKTLQRYGYRYAFDCNNIESYKDDLQMVAKKSRAIEIAIKQKQTEYDRLTKEYQGKPMKQDYFDRLLVELSRHMGYKIRASETTVSEFIGIRASFEREVSAANNSIRDMKLKTKG